MTVDGVEGEKRMEGDERVATVNRTKGSGNIDNSKIDS